MLRTPHVLAVLALTACSIPTSDFHASIDGGIIVGSDTGGNDAGSQPEPGVLAIVASATAVTVDEGATKDVTVTLSRAPSGPLTVALATAATAKLGISVPTLAFTPTSFNEPQTVTLSGLADVDTVDDHAEVTLTAEGVDPVTVAATVHDLDQLQIIASGDSPLMIQEGSTATVNVHLSAQPTGDVVVTALLGTGPVTVSPSMRVFTATNYDVDQVFTFSAPLDADTLASDQSLTFRAASVPDKVLSIHDIDINAQNILVTPGNATITEETTTATLDVSLSQMPGSSSTVTVAITTASGAAHVDVAQLTFNAQNYAVKQTVTVSAVADVDTADGSDTIKLHATDPDHGNAALDRTVAITIKDNDTQKILETAPSPLAVSETTSATFAATLAFKPTSTVVVNVVSLDSTVATASPGTLTFTPADYDQPHTVTVTGVHDNNLVASSCTVRLSQGALTTDVAVSVADVDHQIIVLSTAALTVPEGMSRTFDVSLMYDPGATATVSLADSNASALPIDKTTISFTSANFATPVHVTVSPPVDSNATAESATITASGAGASTAASLVASVVEGTVIQDWGWPMAFQGSFQVPTSFVYAYPISVGAVGNLSVFHTFIQAAAGTYSMALYTDLGGVPGSLVSNGFMQGDKAVVNGVNTSDPLAVTPQLTAPTYWLAIRFSQMNTIGYGAAQAGQPATIGKQCRRIVNVPLDQPWPVNYGGASCTDDNVFNLWITTFHQ